jgi:type IV pilus assembly protein PilA
MLAQAIKRRLSKEENQKGFTLIELLAVIVILGIIAVIAVPLIGNVINKSRSDADVATARQIYDATRMYIIGEKNGDFSGTTIVAIEGTGGLQDKGYLEASLYLPSNKKLVTAGTVNFTSGKLTTVLIKWGTGDNDKKEFTAAQVLSAEPSPTP